MGDFIHVGLYIEGRPLTTPIPEMKITSATSTAGKFFPEIDYNSFEASINAIMRSPHIHGMFDILAGDTDTKRAMRYIRNGKRLKEKNRRRRLKHG